MNITEELKKLNDNHRQELEKWFAEQIYKLNKVNKNEQINLIDKAIQELKYKSK